MGIPETGQMDQGGVQVTGLGDLIGSGGNRSAWCREQDYLPAVSLPVSPISTSSEYPLGTCSLGALCSSLLQYHMRIHKEERKYLCPDCGYKCKWVNQLKYHMTKHTGESAWFPRARGAPLCPGTPSLPEVVYVLMQIWGAYQFSHQGSGSVEKPE